MDNFESGKLAEEIVRGMAKQVSAQLTPLKAQAGLRRSHVGTEAIPRTNPLLQGQERF